MRKKLYECSDAHIYIYDDNGSAHIYIKKNRQPKLKMQKNKKTNFKK